MTATTLPGVAVAVFVVVIAFFAPHEAHADEAARREASRVLSFDDAVTLAKTNGYDVRLAEAGVRSARADVRAAGVLPNPSISGGPTARIDGESRGGSWGGFANLSDEGLIEGAITRKRALKTQVAERALDGARFGREDAARTLVARTKIQYVQTAAAEVRLAFAKDVEGSLAKSVEVNRVRYPRVIDEGQLARVEQEALKASQEVTRSTRALRQEQIELAFLTGLAGSATPDFTVDRDALAFRVPAALRNVDRNGLLALALENRPDRKQARAAIAEGDAAITEAERRRIPDVALLLQYSQLGRGVDSPQPPSITLGLGFTIPVFHQGQAAIAKAEVERDAARVKQARVDAEITTDIDSAFNAFLTARSIVERYESALLERAKRAREIAEIQYNAGSAILTDLLDAHRSWVQVNLDYNAELVNYWSAVFLLEQAMGRDLGR